jgi:hypothetical protein
MRFTELVSILQASVSPVILISGVGLLILSITNRFGRVVDRARQMGAALREAPEPERTRIDAQLKILFRRAQLLRAAVSFSAVSVLMAAVLVIALFLASFLRVEVVTLGAVLFVACLVSLIVSLLYFLQDLNVSLVALRVELEYDHTDPA